MSLRSVDVMAGALMAIAAPALPTTDIQPGLWELVVESRLAASPELPPDSLSMEQCFTKQDAQDPSGVIGSVASMGAADCTYTEKSYSGNVFRFRMECAGSHGIHASGEIAYSDSAMNGSIVTVMEMAGRRAELVSKLHARHLGGC
ncbi:MAG: DUF3617 family protein [Nitrosomonadales bacterium]|nr:DUF3617 family protein [Nitrosomonadales bacterium]